MLDDSTLSGPSTHPKHHRPGETHDLKPSVSRAGKPGIEPYLGLPGEQPPLLHRVEGVESKIGYRDRGGDDVLGVSDAIEPFRQELASFSPSGRPPLPAPCRASTTHLRAGAE